MTIKYQIFISSTYEDLIPHRDNVIQSILKIYHFPIGMEMFSASDHDQWNIIKNTIDSSDYYILIIGCRYGSVTDDGISYTEKEYDYAKSKNIPILSFIPDSIAEITDNKKDNDPEKIKKLNTFINKVKGKPCGFWKNPDDLASQVLAALYKAFSETPQTGWVRGDQVMSKEIAQELAVSGSENRKLEKRVKELESQLVTKKPNLQVLINDSNQLDLLIDPLYHSVKLTQPIEFSKIPKEFSQEITQEEIKEYNKNLPSQKDADKYNEAMKLYCAKENFLTSLAISIKNNGKSKANEVYIELEFPVEVKILEKNEADGIRKPKNPFPINPVEELEHKELKKMLGLSTMENAVSILGRLHSSSILFNDMKPPTFTIPKIQNINYWSDLNENKLTMKLKSLMHTRSSVFDEYVIIPLSLGDYSVNVSVICEEYDQEEKYIIPIQVIPK